HLSTHLSVATLAEWHGGETSTTRVKESHAEQGSLELFQRALTQRNDEAWSLLVERFQGLVLAWVRNHSRREIAYRYHNPEYYVALAFERFWQATTRNQSLSFTSLEAALSYLKASLNGAILDTLRSYARPEVPLPEPGHLHPIELTSEDSTYEHDLWDVIKNLIPTPREQRIAYLLFHCGLKPREIVQFCPNEFPDVREVHRLRRNIVERLLRQADTIRWRLSDEP
ncbi:MAG TPA: hypothetical protein VFN35_01500, partial [Ktedonobacteraceae bacterium]|nr:hypothetical protein [Ktedonobacteraceae bacterium]